MANECTLNLVFKGNPEVLKEIQEQLTNKNGFPNRDPLSYNLIKDLLPGIRDKYVYGLFGWDEMDSYQKKYTPEQEKEFDDKVQNLLKANNWMGLRDGYINDAVRSMKTTIENDTLKLEAGFAWYVPTDFFKFVAEKYEVDMNYICHIEGNLTVLTIKEGDEYIDIEPSKYEEIFKDNKLIDLTISHGLLTAEDLLLTAIYYDNDKAKEFILETYPIDISSLEKSRAKIIELYNDGDSYQESPFYQEEDNEDFEEQLNEIYNSTISLIRSKTSKKTI